MCQKKIDSLLFDKVNSLDCEDEFKLVLSYALERGKRIRAQLVYAFGEIVEVDSNKLDAMACAIETIHSYSLIHDDLPSMDNDDYRRGKLSCHKKYGEGMAILAGDALHSLSFDWILNSNSIGIDEKIKCCQQLLLASGCEGMIRGQYLDITMDKNKENSDGLMVCNQLKTGKLYQSCAALPLSCVSNTIFNNFKDLLSIAETFGILYQMLDDHKDQENSYTPAQNLLHELNTKVEKINHGNNQLKQIIAAYLIM